MANLITDEIFEHMCNLAELELKNEEKEQVKKDMQTLLDYVDILKEVDTLGIEPMSYIHSIDNVFREDEIINENNRDEILANAPETKEGAFVVPQFGRNA